VQPLSRRNAGGSCSDDHDCNVARHEYLENSSKFSAPETMPFTARRRAAALHIADALTAAVGFGEI
jgi:hypothetical protein